MIEFLRLIMIDSKEIAKRLHIIYGLESVFVPAKNTFVLYQNRVTSDFATACEQAGKFLEAHSYKFIVLE
jgi:hypothetical protein